MKRRMEHAAPETAESEFQEGSYDDRRKMKDNSNKDLEELVEKMEELTVHTTWMMYNFIAIRTNPNLINSIQRLDNTFLRCKKMMEKKCQKVLIESGGEGQKKE